MKSLPADWEEEVALPADGSDDEHEISTVAAEAKGGGVRFLTDNASVAIVACAMVEVFPFEGVDENAVHLYASLLCWDLLVCLVCSLVVLCLPHRDTSQRSRASTFEGVLNFYNEMAKLLNTGASFVAACAHKTVASYFWLVLGWAITKKFDSDTCSIEDGGFVTATCVPDIRKI